MARDYDFFGHFGSTIRDLIDRHNALPLAKQQIANAGRGMWLLVASAYSIFWSQAFLGMTAASMVSVFVRAPKSASFSVWLPLAIWAGALVLGVFWLAVGITGSRNARATRDLRSIFWELIQFLVVVALFTFGVYFPRDWDWDMELVNLALRGLYLAYMAAYGLKLLLLVLGPRRGPAPPIRNPPRFS